MPKLLAALSVIGTVAMLWVGGHILLVGADELGWHAPYGVVHHCEEAVHDVGGVGRRAGLAGQHRGVGGDRLGGRSRGRRDHSAVPASQRTLATTELMEQLLHDEAGSGPPCELTPPAVPHLNVGSFASGSWTAMGVVRRGGPYARVRTRLRRADHQLLLSINIPTTASTFKTSSTACSISAGRFRGRHRFIDTAGGEHTVIVLADRMLDTNGAVVGSEGYYIDLTDTFHQARVGKPSTTHCPNCSRRARRSNRRRAR